MDGRGEVFPSPLDWSAALGKLANVHVTTLLAGKVRGNHLHRLSRELLIIKHSDDCQFHWALPGAPPTSRSFSGLGVAIIEIEPEIPHAVLNNGKKDLTIVSLMESGYDPEQPDVVRVALVPGTD